MNFIVNDSKGVISQNWFEHKIDALNFYEKSKSKIEKGNKMWLGENDPDKPGKMRDVLIYTKEGGEVKVR